MRNAALDIAAAKTRGIMLSGPSPQVTQQLNLLLP